MSCSDARDITPVNSASASFTGLTPSSEQRSGEIDELELDEPTELDSESASSLETCSFTSTKFSRSTAHASLSAVAT
eukprot:CAMPEP_0194518142 /NCGR_PEP_ID=MMETSP0253-20130528/51488_1 /TAXON_ID=2966 /ORGANISM="Noctiluca scintillans" /LENGTH=76 /DNA_ID=CAMNT_0039362167 /DNA_START=731 /DNA_END=961 /DNA_ORIENTATION=-